LKFNFNFNFKSRKKADPIPNRPPSHIRTIVDLPREMVERGVLVRVTEGGPELVPSLFEVLAALDSKIEVGYDPNWRGSYAWFVIFDVSYTWRGRSFGEEGVALVKEIGLDVFPSNQEFKIADDGRITWFAQEPPKPEQIAQVVKTTQRQVENIIRQYWFLNKAALVSGKGKKK
jgi:hypothetical protein